VDEETNRIKQHIDTERSELGRNLDEIESRVRSATSVRAHFDKHTGWILGAAVAGGVLLSLAFGRSSDSGSTSHLESEVRNANTPGRPRYLATHLRRVSNTVDDIVDGLVGVASQKLQSFVADAVPGFREQYDQAERQRSSTVH
jgi:hypothetical protein